jgi:hypothetical protein
MPKACLRVGREQLVTSGEVVEVMCCIHRRWNWPSQVQMFSLVNRLLRSASSCQGEEGWLDDSPELGMVEDDSGHVISIGSHCRSNSTGGQEERGDATRVL